MILRALARLGNALERFRDVGETRVPGNLPEEPVRIGKVAGIAAPGSRLSRLDDSATGSHHIGEEAVGIGGRRDVVRQRKAGKPGPLSGDPGISREQVPGVERKPGLAHLEEGNARR